MHTLHLSVHMQDTGAPFTIDSQTVYLRGTLTLVSADNLASNLIAGYFSIQEMSNMHGHSHRYANEGGYIHITVWHFMYTL